MAPLYKVTIEAKIDETFFVRAETGDFARDIAMEHMLDESLGYFSIINEEVEEDEVDEDEVLS